MLKYRQSTEKSEMSWRFPISIRFVVLAGISFCLGACLVRVHDEPLDTAVTPPDTFISTQAADADDLTRTSAKSIEKSFKTWTRSHGNDESNHYSGFSQINRENVAHLKQAWIYTSPEKRTIQANPIFVEGMLIFPEPGDRIVAVDGITGEVKWYFETTGQPAIRGLTYWPGDENTEARIFFPAGNHLYALSLDGKPVSGFGKEGKIDTKTSLVAPAIANGTIVYPVVGDASVLGLDVFTGKLKWETRLLEELPRGHKKSDKVFGGANPWSGIALDSDRGIAYVTTGNPVPTFSGIDRPGNNRNANSLLAIDISDGNILWAFQEIPHDIWDRDIPAPPILTQIKRPGGPVDVVVAVTKIGNTLVLDRVTGKPIYPWRVRKAPSSSLKGEMLADYQPDLLLPEPFAKQVFTTDDLTRLAPENRMFASRIAESARTGFFPPFDDSIDSIFFGLSGGAEWPGAAADPESGILYVASNDVAWRIQLINVASLSEIELPPSEDRDLYLKHCSSCHGKNLQGNGIYPALYGIEDRRDRQSTRKIIRKGQRQMPHFKWLGEDSTDALIRYIRSVSEQSRSEKEILDRRLEPVYQFTGWRRFLDQEGYPANHPPWGWLNALDLNSGKLVWKVPLGSDPALESRGFNNVGTENLGGPVVTAGGLVFVSGTTDHLIRAFDKDSGEELWSAKLPFMGSAAPVVYMVSGKQYIMIPATGGQLHQAIGNAFVAFCLP